MKEIFSMPSNSDLLKKLNEEDGFEPQNFSSSSTLNLNESNDIDKGISQEFLKNKENTNSLNSSIIKSPIQNIFLNNLIKKGKNPNSSYFIKLISKNLLNQPRKKFNNIFIFDWDDTLLCTSVLSPNGYFDEDREISTSTLERISKLEKYVKQILLKAVEKGDTYIISNSELGWIKYSCQRFFSQVYELLNKIKVISARDLYEEKYPNEFKMWKIKAFNDIINNYSLNLPTNIIIFGDSSEDIEAGYNLKSKFRNGFLKFIKFMEYPLISDIKNQLVLLIEKFDIFYSSCKNCMFNLEELKI